MSEIAPRPSATAHPVRSVLEFLVVGICTVTFSLTALGIVMLLITGNGAGGRDVVSYWTAGQRLAHHANPYDAGAVLQLEHSVGYPANELALIMRNPPSALLLALPLGWVSFRAGALLWSLVLLACLLTSVYLLWSLFGRPRSYIHLLGSTFGPALACVLAGQTSLFALLGLCIFLTTCRKHPFWAGLSLWLCALKPHLFLPFGIVLLVWTLRQKSYRLLAGLAVALIASSLIAAAFDPLAWTHYRQMMHTSGIDSEFIPCLSIALRFWVNPSAAWLQYVPVAVASLWAIPYFWTRRKVWDWIEHGSLLLLVSILAAPYAWFTDEALMIPALLHAAYRTRSRALLSILALISAAIEIDTLYSNGMHSAHYLWTAPAFVGWFLYTVHRSEPNGAPYLRADTLPEVAVHN